MQKQINNIYTLHCLPFYKTLPEKTTFENPDNINKLLNMSELEDDNYADQDCDCEGECNCAANKAWHEDPVHDHNRIEAQILADK
jgi:hypothetical protein